MPYCMGRKTLLLHATLSKVGVLCTELGITRQTLYRHVDPKGNLRPDGKKLLSGQKLASRS
jgi:hypothetical protein